MNNQTYPGKPILIVDDEWEILNNYQLILPIHNITNFKLCDNSLEVMPLLARTEFSVIILDIMMPQLSGQELLKQIKENYPAIAVIIATGVNQVATAIDCIKSGAFDYLVKPLDINRLVNLIRHANDIRELQLEQRSLNLKLTASELASPEAFTSFLTNSPKILTIFKYLEAIAPSSRAVLITGESGVGKELIARIVHKLSQRPGAFVAVNIGGLDDNLFADTLFGHKKGAYTGAENERKGLIEKAEDGTLFLDEIGELESASQVKLLRLLQEGEYYTLGSDTLKKSRARIVMATNIDIEQSVANGKLRKDLYYRITAHHIHLPPLRERLEDICLLAEHFMNKAELPPGKKVPPLTAEACTQLMAYDYPGNVRELESLIIEAVSLYKSGELQIPEKILNKNKSAWPGKLPGKDAASSLPDQPESYTKAPAAERAKNQVIKIITSNGQLPTMKEVEAYLIEQALALTGGNQTQVAKLLGLSNATIHRRLIQTAEAGPEQE